MGATFDLTENALKIWRAGVDAVRADYLVSQAVSVSTDELHVAEQSFSRSDLGRVVVVGAGKACAAMADGLESSLGVDFCRQHDVGGWVNVPQGTERSLRHIHCHPARPPGANEPTPEAVQGTRRILDLVESMQQRDLCIALISGGGSALLPAPCDGISLEAKLRVTKLLSSSGANIEQLNTVRKHLSAVKGGKLLRRCRAGRLITLVISDVLGDPLDTIASGPTVVDSTTCRDALDVLATFDPDRSLPEVVYRVLESADRIASDESAGNDPIPVASNFVIGNNATAVDGAGCMAERLGFSHAMQSATKSEGAAEDVGRHMARMAFRMLREPGPDCLISGGEPVVTLVPESHRGRGGRNQQLALAAFGWLMQQSELSEQDWTRITILSGGTDGEDGPTDAAGAVVNASVRSACLRLGLSWQNHLSRNDAYSFFDAVGGLLRTGPTNTNVCDLRVVVVRR